MKKFLQTILICLLCVSMVGCGATETPEEQEVVQEPAETQEETVEPSADENVESEEVVEIDEFSEEYFLSQAKELGIADEALYENMDRDITYLEFTMMMKNAHDLQYGENSNCYLDGWYNRFSAGDDAWRAKDPILLGDISEMVAIGDAVYFRGIERDFVSDFWGANENLWEELGIGGVMADYYWDNQGLPWGLTQDGTLSCLGNELMSNANELQITSWPAATYFMSKYDRVSYDYLYTLPEDGIFPENDTISIKDAILMVLHYYRSLYPLPEYVEIENIGTYDTTIITDELLNKESSLPEASNENLPGEWHGICMCYKEFASWGARSNSVDNFLNERDFQEIKNAGFNYVRIWTSWYHLQDPYMNSENNVNLTDEIRNNSDMVNLQEIKYMDQLIAWAMEYDMHLSICFSDTPGLENPGVTTHDQWFDTDYCTNEIYRNEYVQQETAKWFRAFAKRYADVPNKYLSFNLLNETDPESDEIYAKAWKPTVEAIWEESPGRVIIADVATHTMITGEKMAEMGCALAYHDYTPETFGEIQMDYARENPGFYESLEWPYTDENGNVIDAEATRNMVPYNLGSYALIKETAEKHGVGFIVNEFGYFGGNYMGWNFERDGNVPIHSLEARTAYVEDKINMYEGDGVPWVFGAPIGGFADLYPYQQEGADWYIPEHYHFVFDRNLVNFWKEINGVE